MAEQTRRERIQDGVERWMDGRAFLSYDEVVEVVENVAKDLRHHRPPQVDRKATELAAGLAGESAQAASGEKATEPNRSAAPSTSHPSTIPAGRAGRLDPSRYVSVAKKPLAVGAELRTAADGTHRLAHRAGWVMDAPEFYAPVLSAAPNLCVKDPLAAKTAWKRGDVGWKGTYAPVETKPSTAPESPARTARRGRTEPVNRGCQGPKRQTRIAGISSWSWRFDGGHVGQSQSPERDQEDKKTHTAKNDRDDDEDDASSTTSTACHEPHAGDPSRAERSFLSPLPSASPPQPDPSTAATAATLTVPAPVSGFENFRRKRERPQCFARGLVYEFSSSSGVIAPPPGTPVKPCGTSRAASLRRGRSCHHGTDGTTVSSSPSTPFVSLKKRLKRTGDAASAASPASQSGRKRRGCSVDADEAASSRSSTGPREKKPRVVEPLTPSTTRVLQFEGGDIDPEVAPGTSTPPRIAEPVVPTAAPTCPPTAWMHDRANRAMYALCRAGLHGATRSLRSCLASKSNNRDAGLVRANEVSGIFPLLDVNWEVPQQGFSIERVSGVDGWRFFKAKRRGADENASAAPINASVLCEDMRTSSAVRAEHSTARGARTARPRRSRALLMRTLQESTTNFHTHDTNACPSRDEGADAPRTNCLFQCAR